MVKNISNIEINKNEMLEPSITGNGFVSIALSGEEEIWKVIFYRIGSREDEFIRKNYEEIENSIIFTIVDDTSLIGYATQTGESLILNSSVNYEKKGILTPNQAYLKDMYGISEEELKELIKEAVENELVLRK